MGIILLDKNSKIVYTNNSQKDQINHQLIQFITQKNKMVLRADFNHEKSEEFLSSKNEALAEVLLDDKIIENQKKKEKKRKIEKKDNKEEKIFNLSKKSISKISINKLNRIKRRSVPITESVNLKPITLENYITNNKKKIFATVNIKNYSESKRKIIKHKQRRKTHSDFRKSLLINTNINGRKNCEELNNCFCSEISKINDTKHDITRESKKIIYSILKEMNRNKKKTNFKK